MLLFMNEHHWMKSISRAKGCRSNCYSKTLNNKQDLKLTMRLSVRILIERCSEIQHFVFFWQKSLPFWYLDTLWEGTEYSDNNIYLKKITDYSRVQWYTIDKEMWRVYIFMDPFRHIKYTKNCKSSLRILKEQAKI